MVKIVNITIPNETHALLQKIKQEKGFTNNSETLTWIIKKAEGVEPSP